MGNVGEGQETWPKLEEGVWSSLENTTGGINTIMDLNDNGYLAPGIHKYKLSDFYFQFVASFPTSQTREIIGEGLRSCLEELCTKIPLDEIWLDGSFVSNKVNPNDVDLVAYLSKKEWTPENQQWLRAFMDKAKRNFHCDVYFSVSIDDYANQNDVNQRNYWRGQFGFDREDIPKGMVKLDSEEILNWIKG